MHLSEPSQKGFILPFAILVLLIVSAIAIGTMFINKQNRLTSQNYKGKLITFTAADGLLTLFAQEILNGNQGKYIDTTQFGVVRGKVWSGAKISTVNEFKKLIVKKPKPDYLDSSYYLGSNFDLDDYGVKWTGWLVPPLSGNYTFYSRSDDASAFYLSSDSSISNLGTKAICHLENYSPAWPTTGTGVSKPIALVSGRRYYFEYYHLEGTGNDYGQVGWDGPEFFSERPITGKYISNFAADAAGTFRTLVGKTPVKYRLVTTGLDAYALFTEGLQSKGSKASDTSFRTPLTQYLSNKGAAKTPTDTVWMRTLYYDYHTDNSNPDFENVIGGNITGMVKPNEFLYDKTNADYFGRKTLPKPVLGSTIFGSCGLNRWFVPWKPGDFSIPGYFGEKDFRTCADIKTVAYDTAYKNVVIKDSIAFIRDLTQGSNMYVFNKAIEPKIQFYPIDDRGFDCKGCTKEKRPSLDGKNHNPSFCTEMHTSFTHFSGATFEFRGDDDVWVFINDSLVMDMGGVHGAWYNYLYLDKLKNLKFGNTYNLDFFGCERGSAGSGFKISTNLFIERPKGTATTSWQRNYGQLD